MSDQNGIDGSPGEDLQQPGFDAAAFLSDLTTRPGVYRMLDGDAQVIYVGKARNLKRRVTSYFRGVPIGKTRVMVAQVRDIGITVTHTEGEALLLENQLIKSLKPRYNILLRDDKSYPYIQLSIEHEFPRLSKHRGARGSRGRFFGPFPSAAAVRETLKLLQKVFRVRQCSDTFFRNRSRPCLEYQIERCTAPCVGLIDKHDYAEDVRHTRLFLEGRDSVVVDELVSRMEQAAADLEYELAASLRDRIVKLRHIQERQNVSGDHGDMDVIACDVRNGVACVELFMARGGHNLGNKSFFPRLGAEDDPESVLAAFMQQYYIGRRDVPPVILVSHDIDGLDLLREVLSEQTGRKVELRRPQRGQAVRWLQLAETNLQYSLDRRLAGNAGLQRRFSALQEALKLDSLPQRLECFDISHTMGEGTVASCVVFGSEGAVKSDYRRFNISGITPGDDFAAMQQALERRYTRLKKGEGKLPDILLIDGGKGQLARAIAVME
jgi:excinuclease ABC subunit C